MLAADSSRHCRQPQFPEAKGGMRVRVGRTTQLYLALIGSSFGDR